MIFLRLQILQMYLLIQRFPKLFMRLKLSKPFFAHVMTNKQDVDAKQEELDLWDKAILKWQCVFVVCKFSGVIGARLQLYAESHDEQDASRTILQDVLGIKSPCTAIKRADTLRKFFNWQLKLDCEPWPVHIS